MKLQNPPRVQSNVSCCLQHASRKSVTGESSANSGRPAEKWEKEWSEKVGSILILSNYNFHFCNYSFVKSWGGKRRLLRGGEVDSLISDCTSISNVSFYQSHHLFLRLNENQALCETSHRLYSPAYHRLFKLSTAF